MTDWLNWTEMFYSVATRKMSLKPNNASSFSTLVEMQFSTPDPLDQSLWWGSVFRVFPCSPGDSDSLTLWEAIVLHTQKCLTLCDPMDWSPLGCSVHGILQSRILEWVAISFSRGFSGPRDWTRIFCISRRILYHWATWEALEKLCLQANPTR